MVNNVTDRNNTNNSCDKLYRTHTHTHTHQKGKHDRNRCIISMNKYYTHTKQTEKNTKTDGYRLCLYSYATSSCLCYNLTRDNN